MRTTILITLIALAGVARAQPSAETLYLQGQTAYDARDFATAVAKWQASYDLSKENGLLFNLAQARRLSGDCAGALATYRRFVSADPDLASEQHKLAEDLARELEGRCPAQTQGLTIQPLVEPTLTKRSDATRTGRAWKVAGIVTGGVGVVAIGVGLGLGHHGRAIGDEITAACRTSCDWATLKDKDARGRREVSIGKVLDVVGVAALAGGAVFYYLGVREERLVVAPLSGGGTAVSWSGSW